MSAARWAAALLLAAAAWAQAPATTADAPDPQTGAIEGTVVNAASSTPIEGANVWLNGQTLQTSASTPTASSVQLTATSDSSGHFAFRGLAAGSYWLNGQHSGFGPGTNGAIPLALGPGDRKSGADLQLIPLGSIAGRATDEFGAPAANCYASALQYQSQSGARRLVGRGGASTNDKGEYRIEGLEKGRFYVSLRCSDERVAPHALMSPRDPRIPYAIRAPLFYPGTQDAGGATAVVVAQGAQVQGIDFQMQWTAGLTLRGRVAGVDLSQPDRNVQVVLLPARPDATELMRASAGVNRNTGEFQMRGLVPGSYVLVGWSMGKGTMYHARLPIEIGARPPDPVRMLLTPVPEVAGTVEFVGDNPPSFEALRISLEALDATTFGQVQQVPVSRDGAFSLAGVTPGRWRLNLYGANPGYVKSLTWGEKDVSPYGFDVPAGAGGQVKIVVSTATGRVQPTLMGALPDGQGQAIFALLPADLTRMGAGLERYAGINGNGETTIENVAPGKYRLFAFVSGPGYALPNDLGALQAIERFGQPVEVKEGETVRTSVNLVGTEELKRAVEDAQ